MIMLASPKPAFFEAELKTRPKAIRLTEKDYVVWKSGKQSYNVLVDKCSHRSAKLSTGMIVNNNIECPYHGWQFNGCGRCVKIPQAPANARLPSSAIHIKDTNYIAKAHDGVVWMYPCSKGSNEEVNTICRLFNFANNPSYLLTERAFDAPYSYYLQIENLLDPAHINFVHDGFQGDKQNAGAISLDHIEVNGTFMSATFSHPGQNIPRVQITFWMPYGVEVSVYNDDDVVRKNVIYVIPTSENCCRVLFRDVVVTKHISPQEPFSKALVQFIAHTDSYKNINANIVEDIFNQDLSVLEGQQANVGSYQTSQYVLPTESDRLIVEYRKWARKTMKV